jgi:hypothetical protein
MAKKINTIAKTTAPIRSGANTSPMILTNIRQIPTISGP